MFWIFTMNEQQLEQAKERATHHGYVRRVLLGLDLFGNIVTGGKVGETISARSQRAADRGNKLGKFMVWWLDKLQPSHGVLAEEGDLGRAEAVEQTEEQALKGK